LFYEHAGILLNLGESLSPVLIAKIQHGAPHPQEVLERFTNPGGESEDELSDFAAGFESDEETFLSEKGNRMGDIEWIAFETYQDDDSDVEEEDEDSEDAETVDDLAPAMSTLNLNSSSSSPSPFWPIKAPILPQQSSLSLLEYLLRLAALQTFEQQSHMNLTDEHIVLFLRDDNPSSRQQPLPQERGREIRREPSEVSISSDFSSRVISPALQFPISPPHSEQDGTHSSSPISEKNPVKRNPRDHLEKAMATDYHPMTPVARTRVARYSLRKTSTGMSIRGK
jgi:hypothetical protein